jgi:hypothetical protein
MRASTPVTRRDFVRLSGLAAGVAGAVYDLRGGKVTVLG